MKWHITPHISFISYEICCLNRQAWHHQLLLPELSCHITGGRTRHIDPSLATFHSLIKQPTNQPTILPSSIFNIKPQFGGLRKQGARDQDEYHLDKQLHWNGLTWINSTSSELHVWLAHSYACRACALLKAAVNSKYRNIFSWAFERGTISKDMHVAKTHPLVDDMFFSLLMHRLVCTFTLQIMLARRSQAGGTTHLCNADTLLV